MSRITKIKKKICFGKMVSAVIPLMVFSQLAYAGVKESMKT